MCRTSAACIPEDPNVTREDGVDADRNWLSRFHCECADHDRFIGSIHEGMDELELVLRKDEAFVVEERQLPNTSIETSVFDVSDEAHFELAR